MTKEKLYVPNARLRVKSERIKIKPRFKESRNQINLRNSITGNERTEETVEAVCSDFKEHTFIEKVRIFHGRSKTIFRSRH